MAELAWRSNHRAAGDGYLGDAPRSELAPRTLHPLDSPKNRKVHRQLMQWFYYERDRQAPNRLEMAIDHDFYDNLQWDEEDAAILEDRGQAPLVYNEVAPMCDWIIGTERRSRVDWKVLPRTEDDVQLADTKTKVLKYVSDVNKVPFARSRAFADAIKGGLGWVDDGVRDDPTKDPIYSKYEDWRCVLNDSSALGLDGEDDRYVFRWRHVDEDIACLMFPDRKDRIYSAVEDYTGHVDPLIDEDTFTPQHDGTNHTGRSGTYSWGSGYAGEAMRRRVRLIECQFRMPVATKVITSGPLRGAYFDTRDVALADSLARVGGTVIDKIMMRVHVAVFTETDLLFLGPSIYRHNKFSLTPVWCYRRGRDRMPYGVVRRVRDIQRDLNKRASKALWLLNTNQLVGDLGAVEDVEQARDEAQRPDGVILTKQGKDLVLRRDTDAATGQLQIMAMDAQSIQRSAGVPDENRGLKTNAVSGEAIKARQLQGAVATTECFDNLRLAVQVQGEKQLALTEQFYTEERVVRLTGARGALEWIRINQPEPQPDGSIRYLNDITASCADFVVSEADHNGTLRQVMFDSVSNIAQKMPDPVSAIRVMTIAMEFSDLPNKDDIAAEFRRITGDRDPNKQLTEEEAAAAAQQMQQQAEAMEVAKAQAMATLEEQRGKARKVNAEADKVLAEIEQLGAGSPEGEGDGSAEAVRQLEQQMAIEAAVRKVQEAAATEIDRLTQQLAKLQADQTTAILKIRKDADTATETARIQADGAERAARITAASNESLDALVKKIEVLARTVDDVRTDSKRSVEDLRKDTQRDVADAKKAADEAAATAEEASTAAEEAAKEAAEAAKVQQQAAAAAPAAAPAAPAAPAAAGGARRAAVSYRYDKDGELVGAVIKRADGSTDEVTIDREGKS